MPWAEYADNLHQPQALSFISSRKAAWHPPGMDATQHKVQVGYRLRMAIEAVGQTQAAVARELKVSPSKLGNWIRGDDYPNEWFVFRFCTRYSVTADWIYLGTVSGVAEPLAAKLWAAQEEVSAASTAPGPAAI